MKIKGLKNHLNTKSLSISFYVIATLVIIFGQGGVVNALSSEQQEIFSEGINFFDVNSGSSSCSTRSTVLTGSDNEQKVWNYFVSQGLSDAQTAGIMGNLEQESGFNPEVLESGGTTQDPASAGHTGYGLAQWYTDNIEGEAAAANVSGPIYELATQLNLIMAELQQGKEPYNASPSTLNTIKSTTDASQVATLFDNYFEGGTDPGGTGPGPTDAGPGGIREQNAVSILQQYGGTSSGEGITSTSGNCVSVSCSSSGGTSGISQTRQNIICIAQQELALWQSQPGYPTPSYSETGYLDYSQGRTEEWCADFASWVYNQAGDPLQTSPNWNVSYVPNIQSIGELGQNFQWHPASSGYTPQPGDLAIYGANHVNIFISYSNGTAEYIGGDQGSGPYPGGSIVSTETGSGYYDNGITGYVSPK